MPGDNRRLGGATERKTSCRREPAVVSIRSSSSPAGRSTPTRACRTTSTAGTTRRSAAGSARTRSAWLRATLTCIGMCTTDPIGKVWWNPYCLESLNVFVAHSCCLACRWSLDVRDSATEAARLGQAFADRVNSDRASGVNIALRHCFASALLAVREGCNCAGCIGDARERYQTWCQGQSEQNRQIANYNNWRGRQCAGCSGESARHGRGGGDVASIMKCCLKKLSDGELFVPGGGWD